MKKQRKEQIYRGDFVRYPDNDNGVWYGRYKDLQYDASQPPRTTLIKHQDLIRKTVIVNGKHRTKVISPSEQKTILQNRWKEEEPRMIKKHRRTAIAYEGSAPSERHTFYATTREYIAKALPNKSLSVRLDYKRYIKYWESQFGNKALADIEPEHITKCREELAAHVISRSGNGKGNVRSPATVNRHLMCLSSVFKFAKSELHWLGKNEENPCGSVSKLTEPDGRTRFLSKEEVKLFRGACKGISNQLYTAALLALTTGGRKMEIWNLKRADIDLNNRKITFWETKSGKPRSVRLVEEAYQLLAKYPYRIDTKQVFPGIKNKDQAFDFRVGFERALSVAGITDFHWHDLRHTCASYLKMGGVDDRTIMEIMG